MKIMFSLKESNIRCNNPITKEVSYFGLIIQIPKQHKYITTDKDGYIFSHVVYPTKEYDSWISDSDFELIGELDGYRGDASESLLKVIY